MGDKADWGDFFFKHLIDVCKGEIEAGNRPQGLWTSTGWKNIVAKFEAKTSDKRTKIQLKNKLDNLKKRICLVHGVKELCYWTWMGCSKGDC